MKTADRTDPIPAGEKPRLLLHSCCGPCSTAVVERLSQRFRIVLFFYNPNITEEEEYRERLAAQRSFITAWNKDHPEDPVELWEGKWDPERYLEAVKGLEKAPEGGERCQVCFRLRLGESAGAAKERRIPYFATTLSVSPHKHYPTLLAIGTAAGAEQGVAFLDEDFKKKDGFLRSIRMSKEYGLYRQDYCGCIFSRRTGPTVK